MMKKRRRKRIRAAARKRRRRRRLAQWLPLAQILGRKLLLERRLCNIQSCSREVQPKLKRRHLSPKRWETAFRWRRGNPTTKMNAPTRRRRSVNRKRKMCKAINRTTSLLRMRRTMKRRRVPTGKWINSVLESRSSQKCRWLNLM